MIAGKKTKRPRLDNIDNIELGTGSYVGSSSNSSRISTKQIKLIIDKLVSQSTRNSTTQNYLRIRRQFNKFVINLDVKPRTWEDRAYLFMRYKIDLGMQSSTVKSYVSAIKKMLINDGYDWDNNKVLLGALTKACKIVNDKVHTRLPIQCSLLEMLLFEIQRKYGEQLYLQVMYKALFAISYYGVMRVSEVTASEHVMKAANIHAAQNKEKIMIKLNSSKTHSKGMKPQTIKITSNSTEKSGCYARRIFCPFKLIKDYMLIRGDYNAPEDQFFIFTDGTPVGPQHVRALLKNCLEALGLDATLYGFHSFRVGRTTDLIK